MYMYDSASLSSALKHIYITLRGSFDNILLIQDDFFIVLTAQVYISFQYQRVSDARAIYCSYQPFIKNLIILSFNSVSLFS